MSSLHELSDTICPWPWTTIHVGILSDLSHCCEQHSLPTSVRETSLQDFWNSNLAKEVRATMLAGKWHKSCQVCHKRELNGIRSKRQMALKRAVEKSWHGYSPTEIFDIVKQGTHVNTPIKQIDLRLGTTCNLACRMCSPISSSMWSQIVEENEQAFKDGEWNSPIYQAKESIESQSSRWWQQKKFLSSLIEACGGLHELNITGGEPTLIPELIDVLKQLNKDCVVQLTTNGTLFNQKLYNELSKFKETWFILSIDGIGDTYNYIRHPGDWKIVNSNVNKFKDYVKEIHVETATTIFNILDLTNIWTWCNENNLDILLPNWVSDPGWTSVYAIPQIVKNKALEKISTFNEDKNIDITHNAVTTLMNTKFSENYFNTFKKNYKVQDKIYSKQLKDYIPELHNLIKEI
tara:strand:+ start:87 stop:1304 length:1218 start_codon:yes stop_codon:yes gene_type:complete